MISVLLAAVLIAAAGKEAQDEAWLRPLFRAIRLQETGSEKDPVNAVGDRTLKYKAYGPYQIRYPYWWDAHHKGKLQVSKKLVAEFLETARSYPKSEDTMKKYWRRYASAALRTQNLEALARVHNGGPGWRNAPQTKKYWEGVRRGLKQGRK